jgi:hypothetical protein
MHCSFSAHIGRFRIDSQIMIYRVHIDERGQPEGERWFARQVESQFAQFADRPLPEELQRLLDQLSAVSERPSS